MSIINDINVHIRLSEQNDLSQNTNQVDQDKLYNENFLSPFHFILFQFKYILIFFNSKFLLFQYHFLQSMGQPLSCNTTNTITKGHSIDSGRKDTRKKINPLHYIQPIRFRTEDHNVITSDAVQVNSMETGSQKNEKKRGKRTSQMQFLDLLQSMQETRKCSLASKQNINNSIKSETFKEASTAINKQLLEVSAREIDSEIVKVKWNKFIKMKTRSFQEDYRIINQIGRGGFGCVYKVVMKNGHIERAAKKINKDHLKEDEHQHLLAQMAIMMSLDHPNITKLFQVYDQKSHYIMVLELCEGGELFQKIINRSIRQSEARTIIDQLLNALNYLHQRGIVHRDLKPENVLFEKKTKLVKIIDFGISKKIKAGQFLTARVGTPYYIAPEVLYRKYNQKCDIWSLGVILYMIVYNFPPFKGSDPLQVMQNIVKDDIYYKSSANIKFSQKSIEFLKYLLQKDPQKRPSAKESLCHPWIREKKLSVITDKSKEQILERITKFHFKDKLQAVVHTYIVSQLLTSEQRIELLDIFRELDANNNGIIDKQQIKEALLKRNFQKLDEKKVKRIFEYIDTNCSGQIDYTEFIVAAIDFNSKVNQKHFEQAFAYFDIDNSGEITFEEVVQFLQNQIESREEIKKMFMSVDQNGDGVISKSEFVELLVNRQNESRSLEISRGSKAVV